MRSTLRMSQPLLGILTLALCLPVHAGIGHVEETGITQNRLTIPVPPPQLPNTTLAKQVEAPMGAM